MGANALAARRCHVRVIPLARFAFVCLSVCPHTFCIRSLAAASFVSFLLFSKSWVACFSSGWRVKMTESSAAEPPRGGPPPQIWRRMDLRMGNVIRDSTEAMAGSTLPAMVERKLIFETWMIVYLIVFILVTEGAIGCGLWKKAWSLEEFNFLIMIT